MKVEHAPYEEPAERAARAVEARSIRRKRHPLPIRLYRNYRGFRNIGLSTRESLRASWLISTA